MTQLTRRHPTCRSLWFWMFIAGLGIGPTFVGLHDRRPERRAVQQARRRDQQPDVLPPDRRLGRARHRRHASSARACSRSCRGQLTAAGRAAAGRQPVQPAPGRGVDFDNLDRRRRRPGQPILALVPAAFRPPSQPLIPAIVDGHPRGLQHRRRLGLLARRGQRRSWRPSPPWPSRRSRSARRTGEAPGSAGAPAPATAARRSTGRPRPTDLAPPLVRRPRWSATGAVVRFRRYDADDDRRDPRPFPPHLQAPGHGTDAPFEAVARRRRAAAGVDAAGHARRSRRPARPHAERDRRDRRPLPAHERAAVDRRARRLRRRLPAARGPVRPAHRRRRSRCRRPAASTPTAATTRPGRRPAASRRSTPRQEGRGAPADPRPAIPLLPACGSSTAGSRSRSRAPGAGDRRRRASAELVLGRVAALGAVVARRPG